jgi:hypothetical protein
MQNNTLTGLIFLGVLGVIALLFINIAPTNNATTSPQLSSIGDVKGSALYHKNLPYTLNFEQQKVLIEFLNRAAKVKKTDFTFQPKEFSFDSIVLYRFDGSNLEIIPVAVKEKNIIFNIPKLSEDSYFLEMSGGQLSNVLNGAFDP